MHKLAECVSRSSTSRRPAEVDDDNIFIDFDKSSNNSAPTNEFSQLVYPTARDFISLSGKSANVIYQLSMAMHGMYPPPLAKRDLMSEGGG